MWTLLGLTVAVFALQWLSRTDPQGITADLWYAGLYSSDLAPEPWRMLTYAFVHDDAGPTHLALNMVALWMLGRVLEPLLGWWRFLSLYLLSAVGGAVFALWTTHPLQPVVGASGAIYGLFAALFFLARSAGGQVRSIVVLIALNLVFSLLIPGISWQVHVGGLLTGALVGAVLTAVGGRTRGRAGVVGAGSRVRAGAAAIHAVCLVAVLALLVGLTAAGAERVVPALMGG